MEEAADEMQRLSLSTNGDSPDAENVANEDKVLTAAERLVLQQVCDEYADEDNVRCNEIAYVIDRILARTKSNDNTQDGAEPSPASAGSTAWLPVGEQLPELGIEVVALWDGVPEFASLLDDGAWWIRGGSARFTATHWMPIPAPPTDAK